jgi:hypothetical protein
MSSGTQVDLDWAGPDAVQDGVGIPPAAEHGRPAAKYLTDEEILGLESVESGGPQDNSVIPSGRTEDSRRGEARDPSSIDDGKGEPNQRDSSGKDGPRNDSALRAAPDQSQGNTPHAGAAAMPEWMRAAAADPRHSAEAAALWREHQEFRAAFASPEEARAVKELLPGGVRDVLSLREATQSVDRIDAALFSGDARAQAEVVAELARANPAAFRSLFAEAAKVVAGLGTRGNEVGGREARNFDGSASRELTAGPTLRSGSGQALREDREGWGARNSEAGITNHQSPVTSHQSPNFDPAAYAEFERATNDAVARDVRGSIHDTLARVMPEGVAEGAARRIGEDIFNEVHRALAADRTLSEQVASVLRDRRFGGPEQQRVASLLAGRARQLVPSVARRVIGEWTSTVLNTARSKAARQAAAASRVDIVAPGGSLDSMPLRQMSPREVNYASMSDEEILGM